MFNDRTSKCDSIKFVLSFSSTIQTVVITPESQSLPSVAPYNRYSITCSTVSQMRPSDIMWVNADTGLPVVSGNGITIDMSETEPLSTLIVTETVPGVYRFYCNVSFPNGDTVQSSLPLIATVKVTGKRHTYNNTSYMTCMANLVICHL